LDGAEDGVEDRAGAKDGALVTHDEQGGCGGHDDGREEEDGVHHCDIDRFVLMVLVLIGMWFAFL